MLRIGVTGGIGSGKSLVCKVFEILGVPVYYTDLRTRTIQILDEEVVAGIKAIFGEEAYSSPYQLNRTFIAGTVFHDKEKLAKLNALVHPKVFEDFEQWCTDHAKYKYVLKESALTFETGFHKKLDKVVVVTAPEQVRIKRVLHRDTFRTEADIKTIIERQMPESVKVKQADFVLENDEKHLLIPEILRLEGLFSRMVPFPEAKR
ncbi:MAG: dephospho-CoA kinase [Cytophagales bacterium]